jgi:hypothetical protein
MLGWTKVNYGEPGCTYMTAVKSLTCSKIRTPCSTDFLTTLFSLWRVGCVPWLQPWLHGWLS